MATNPGIKIYTSHLPVYNTLTDAQLGWLIRSALTYRANGELPDYIPAGMEIHWGYMAVELGLQGKAYAQCCAASARAADKRHADAVAAAAAEKTPAPALPPAPTLYADADIAPEGDWGDYERPPLTDADAPPTRGWEG